MSLREDAAHIAREAVEVMATGRLPYAALVLSSMVLGYELFR